MANMSDAPVEITEIGLEGNGVSFLPVGQIPVK